MKKRKLSFKYFLLYFFVLLGIIVGILRFISPDIVLFNHTNKVIYLRTMQSVERDEEPTLKEAMQLKRTRVIQPGKQLRFTIFWATLFSKDRMRFDMDWRIGSRVFSEAEVGGKFYFLDRYEGSCRVKIEIQEGSYKVIPVDQLYCYKKLKMPEK